MQTTVKILKSCWCGSAGDIKEVGDNQARRLIADGYAELDANGAEVRAKRQAESQELQNKAMAAKAKRDAGEPEADKKKPAAKSKGSKKISNKAMSA